MNRTRFALVCATTATLAYAAWLKHDAMLGVDDAQIAFSYASHLADGAGFVYNRGGERVEGFTSMLWVLIASPFFAPDGFAEPLLAGLTVLMTAATCATGAVGTVRWVQSHAAFGAWLAAMVATRPEALLIAPMRNLPADPRFADDYRPAEVCNVTGSCVRAFYRRDFLDRLGSSGAVEVHPEESAF